MRTHEPTVTRDIKAHFERISQLFRSGLPVRTGTVGRWRSTRRARLRLARAYGDGWGPEMMMTRPVPACPCVRGRLEFAVFGPPVHGRLARAYGDGWSSLSFPVFAGSACPCVRGRLEVGNRAKVVVLGLPVRTGTVGARCLFRYSPGRLARAYGDGWKSATGRRSSYWACPCVRGRLAGRRRRRVRTGRLARAYGDGWCTSMRPYNS